MMRGALVTLALLAGLTVAPGITVAQGVCPTRADLDTGIRLTRTRDYMTTVVTRQGNKQIEERITKRGGKTQRIRSTYLHPLAVAQRQSSTSVLTMKYARNTQSLRNLDRKGAWRSKITILNGTKVVDQGEVTLRYKGKSTHTIGKCTYPVWSVVETLKLGKMALGANEKLYAPDLGVVLAFYRLNPRGARVSSFEPTQISAE